MSFTLRDKCGQGIDGRAPQLRCGFGTEFDSRVFYYPNPSNRLVTMQPDPNAGSGDAGHYRGSCVLPNGYDHSRDPGCGEFRTAFQNVCKSSTKFMTQVKSLAQGSPQLLCQSISWSIIAKGGDPEIVVPAAGVVYGACMAAFTGVDVICKADQVVEFTGLCRAPPAEADFDIMVSGYVPSQVISSSSARIQWRPYKGVVLPGKSIELSDIDQNIPEGVDCTTIIKPLAFDVTGAFGWWLNQHVTCIQSSLGSGCRVGVYSAQKQVTYYTPVPAGWFNGQGNWIYTAGLQKPSDIDGYWYWTAQFGVVMNTYTMDDGGVGYEYDVTGDNDSAYVPLPMGNGGGGGGFGNVRLLPLSQISRPAVFVGLRMAGPH